MDIASETSFDSVRPALEKTGFSITEHPYVVEAAKRQITIFTVGTTNKIERIEAWCP